MCHGIYKGRTHVGGVGTKLASVLGASHFFSFEVCRIKNNLRCARHRKYSRSESIEHTRHGFERRTFFTLGENVRFCLAAVDAGGKVLDELVHS